MAAASVNGSSLSNGFYLHQTRQSQSCHHGDGRTQEYLRYFLKKMSEKFYAFVSKFLLHFREGSVRISLARSR